MYRGGANSPRPLADSLLSPPRWTATLTGADESAMNWRSGPVQSSQGGTLGKGIPHQHRPGRIGTLTGGDESAMNLGDSSDPIGPVRAGGQDGVSRQRAWGFGVGPKGKRAGREQSSLGKNSLFAVRARPWSGMLATSRSPDGRGSRERFTLGREKLAFVVGPIRQIAHAPPQSRGPGHLEKDSLVR